MLEYIEAFNSPDTLGLRVGLGLTPMPPIAYPVPKVESAEPEVAPDPTPAPLQAEDK